MKTIVHRVPTSQIDPFSLSGIKDYLRVTHDDEDLAITQMARASAAELEHFAQIALLTQTIRVTVFDPVCGPNLPFATDRPSPGGRCRNRRHRRRGLHCLRSGDGLQAVYSVACELLRPASDADHHRVPGGLRIDCSGHSARLGAGDQGSDLPAVRGPFALRKEHAHLFAAVRPRGRSASRGVDMTDVELDQILTLQWPSVVRRIMGDPKADDFAKGFARSIARHGKRPSWRPSQKQARIMREMVDQYGRFGEPDPQLIERG